jgi:glyoxylase I family protein
MFSHVALNCRDMAVTEAFYTKHFGFRRVRAVDLGGGKNIVYIRSGAVTLELFAAASDVADNAADGPEVVGMRHLAFQVDDVDAAVAALGGAAEVTLGPLDFSGFIPGWKTTWVRDPDGIIVEISQGFTEDEELTSREATLAGSKA